MITNNIPAPPDPGHEAFGRALKAIESGDLDAASGLAAQLLELRYSGSYEIEALIAQAKGDVESAVGHLQQGVQAAPDAWSLWQLLGNFQSNLKRFADAEACYVRALECERTLPASIIFNQALLASRQGRWDQALSFLETIPEVEDVKLAEAIAKFELKCRRQHRGHVLEQGSIFDVMLDAPCVVTKDEPEGTRFFQRVHVAAANEAEVLQIVVEDLGEDYQQAVVSESSKLQDGDGFYAGVYWFDKLRHLYSESSEG